MKLLPGTAFRQIISVVSITLFINCHKDHGKTIEGVTGYTWNIYSIQASSDYYLNPMPTDWQLNLNTDQILSFHLGNSTGGGTFSWTQIDSTNASVALAIGQWTSPAQFSTLSDKLKRIVEAVDKVYIFRPRDFSGLYPPPPLSPSMVMRFEGSQGYFNVSRW